MTGMIVVTAMDKMEVAVAAPVPVKVGTVIAAVVVTAPQCLVFTRQ